MRTIATPSLGTCIRGTLLAIAMAVSTHALAADAPVDSDKAAAQRYSRLPLMSNVRVSPSGERMAMIVSDAEGHRRLAVMDLDPVGKPRIVAAFNNANVTMVRWVNDERLVFKAYPQEYAPTVGGTFAINQDGSDQRQLIAPSTGRGVHESHGMLAVKVLPGEYSYLRTIDDGSDDIIVEKSAFNDSWQLTNVTLARLDTVTGLLRGISAGAPADARYWSLDAKGQPRMVSTYTAGRTHVFWHGSNDAPWNEVANFDANQHEEGFEPWYSGTDGQILVTSRQKDVEAVFNFNTTTRRIDTEPLLTVKGFDLAPEWQIDSRTGKLMGVYYSVDRPQAYWFDDKLAGIQRAVDKALPGRENTLYCGRCESTRFVVARSQSDRQPGEFFLFDRRDNAMQRIGVELPWIDEQAQGHRSFRRVAARDGESIPLYLTRPAAAPKDAKLPAVVLVHGGPFLRGIDIEWSAEAQFLASRGYEVIEPEFRGSDGYGWKHYHAGFRQWGFGMIDDLADAVAWTAKQGLIDADRVCITGGSYGGYAALMAPIRSPGVYRCAASFAGVTDLDLMYDLTWSDFSDAYKQYGMPVLVGDQHADAAALAQQSPLKRVREIKVPLLVAHGARDTRVPMVHESQFVHAARDAGLQVEEVVYSEEGHGFANPADEADYFEHLAGFLARNLSNTTP